jgi:hypothetical protein
MFPEICDVKVCVKCNQVLIHQHIKECPECLGKEFIPMSILLKTYKEGDES